MSKTRMCRIRVFDTLRFTPRQVQSYPPSFFFCLLLWPSILPDQEQVPFQTFAHHVDEGPLGVSPEKAGPQLDDCISKASWILIWWRLPIF